MNPGRSHLSPDLGEFTVMRRFKNGSGADREVVVIEVDGPRMSVVWIMPDGEMKRTQTDLGSDAEALAASDQMAQQLFVSGFSERGARRRATTSRASARSSTANAKPPRPQGLSSLDDLETPAAAPSVRPRMAVESAAAAAGSKPAKKMAAAEAPRPENPSWLDDVEPPAATPSVVLPRMAVAPAEVVAAGPKPAKKKAGGKKKRKKAKGGDELDMRVLVGIGAFAALIVGCLGFVAYDAFLKPPTIVGSWSGSMIEHEIGKKLTHTRYDLILDADRRASMTLQQKFTETGTYTLAGDQLELKLRGEDGDETKKKYKIVLGSVTLDLMDPQTGELAVQLLRARQGPAVAGKSAPSLAAPSGLGEADPAADAALASVDFSAKDSAFRLRYPPGWQHDTGSRADNTYSWVRITKGSATIEVHADIKGSLLSGSDFNQQPQPEGSETAPVHVAHELAKRSTAEGFSGYSESKPAVFKGAKLGEGRISQFTASGGLFGSKIHGFRVTLLTNDRRVSILCHCPDKEFAGYRPTFLAVCHSLAR
jgi:hypothetical protein